MPKVMALDFGLKRTGIAVTDDLKMMAFGLKAVETKSLMDFLKTYVSKNQVDEIVIGQPKHVDGQLMALERNILWLIEDIKKDFPKLKIIRIDERYSSKMASQAIAQSGLKNKKKRSKGLIDEISATLILQDYLN
ncbi:Holliday junction resolvase RuvX [Flavobacterium sp. CS20]|jgi:putative Holliday junction resolvase|uniref:Holliday junction resolvase RuvX n=1 Tax=Flavobacterium sp. CS20 TaxID=2775246 RepID=UPI001B39E78B|nr:Holliday junction resolvase RuvX [Flavobacterium sp. CS20]QTY27436.1 Holliday junction resolvase RuvX [Flavobacterium sp. CS20]